MRLATVGFVVLLTACIQAHAQDYDELPLFQVNNKPIQAWSQLNSALDDKTKSVAGMLGGDAMDTTAFDQYFNDIVFPLFTEWKDVKIGSRIVSPLAEGIGGRNPPGMRALFKHDFAAKATNTAAHERLNDLTLKKMDEIASGNFHPVVRANAVMMIADLNDTDTNGPASNPSPWKQALPILWKYATAKDSTDAVRIPAWRGLVRQAQAPGGIDADHRPAVIGAAVDALQKRNDLGGGTQDAKDWICRRAIDVLVALYGATPSGAAPNPDVTAALFDTINDSSTSVTVRAAAAAATAKVKLNLPQNFDPNALAKSLGKLAVDDYKNELDTASANHAPIVADRLAQQLGEIRQGFVGGDGNGGVRVMSTAPDFQKYVDSMIGALDNVIAACSTQPLPAPTPTQPAYGGASLVIPIDRQRPISEAIAAAGATLEAAVQREAAAPAAVPGAAPRKSALDNNPLGG
ncbi:MAG TPA: hypothetical protein VMJ32_07090 [Pirellulales bacterium]|nr:hypothetical protein [Pirellulales bacterium]